MRQPDPQLGPDHEALADADVVAALQAKLEDVGAQLEAKSLRGAAEKVFEVGAHVDGVRQRIAEVETQPGAPRVGIAVAEHRAVTKAEPKLQGISGVRP